MRIVHIETQVGNLQGRDAIYLDSVDYQPVDKVLKLIGEINLNLSSEGNSDDFAPYVLEFRGIHSYSQVHLDVWIRNNEDCFMGSSFYEVLDDEEAAKASIIKGEPFKKFIVQTYDHVFEIISINFQMSMEMNIFS
ncbi:MAG: hypothetical protein N4A57_12050 [Anaeromicrobium sp.]|jgi:hypothetical protein|uniref:hypothetical protein n=1 Tax=Anaeromicrobium sp. TaxID=1929132 RepID=UPI0025D4B636|nr:hypothetical protein [Anaeromicrobium sp.]MCT4594985.1 hypothetical protein [Anaeromicrobium sp.]